MLNPVRWSLVAGLILLSQTACQLGPAATGAGTSQTGPAPSGSSGAGGTTGPGGAQGQNLGTVAAVNGPQAIAQSPTPGAGPGVRAPSLAGNPGTGPGGAGAPSPAPPAAPPIVPFLQAVSDAANALFTSVKPSGFELGLKVPLVVDPLIDGHSWMQTAATRQMEAAVLDLVRQRYPQFEPMPFNTSSLARGPLVFIGTFTPLDEGGKIEGPTAYYRVCLALVDLRSGKIVGKGFARAAPQGVDSSPLPFFQESPGWTADEATTAYVRTCQGTTVGQAIQPAYWDRVAVAAVVSDAINAYNNSRYEEAMNFYRSALSMPGGQQLRVYNGIYLTATRLNRQALAFEAFGQLLDYGIRQKRIAVKMLFKPGQAQFVAEPSLAIQYAMWLRQIATRSAAAPECMAVVGHSSRTGPEPANERLSMQRAVAVQQRLVALNRQLDKRLKAVGLGSSKAISGTGTDDARDAIDRRVEFQVQACAAA